MFLILKTRFLKRSDILSIYNYVSIFKRINTAISLLYKNNKKKSGHKIYNSLWKTINVKNNLTFEIKHLTKRLLHENDHFHPIEI